LRRAVALGLPQLAHKLVGGQGRLGLFVERLLYDEGYCDAAAELMLNRYSTDGVLDGGHSLRLGEMLYMKGLYAEALALFEGAIEREQPGERQSLAADGTAEAERFGEHKRLRLGAAAACLQIALQALKQAPSGGSPNWDGGWAEPDARRLEEALLELNGLGWKTRWNGMQRRRKNGEAPEARFLMYDREG
jgi:tetratricopeptide (TPR) repeat protein